jgi:drug/metabolite transporter (DMT)-like permease
MSPTLRGMAWVMLSGLIFVCLNTILRGLAMEMNALEVQTLRYIAGGLALAPLVVRGGARAFMPASGVAGQMARGLVHSASLMIWFIALPHIPLAETTAIGFTAPIFVMIGAVVFLKETMIWERWVAAVIGFAGVLVVLSGGLTGGVGYYSLVMLSAQPLAAGSYLITKALTRHDRAEVIVLWQAITVSAFTLPFALAGWTWPNATQWALLVGCGLLGSVGHYSLTRAFIVADISATQPAKFFDMVWSSALGWLAFSEIPTRDTLIGAAIILAVTTWLARRERNIRMRAITPA